MSGDDPRRVAGRILSAAAGRHLLLLSDFDGTLCEFHPDPAAVVLAPSRRALLETIARAPGTTIGLVSGRRLDDVRRRAGLDVPAWYAGLHGLEIEGDDVRFVHPGVARTREAIERLRVEIAGDIAGIRGTFVEDKGLSMAAHFREASHEDAARVQAIVDERSEPYVRAGALRRMRGACLIELLPDIEWHKGSAVDWILEHVAREHADPAVVYLGDDVTDEDAFRALAGRGISVAASDRVTGADCRLDGPAGIERLLEALAAASRQ
jgi:trehalose-phosphatase